jgi:hypothetical protein
MKNIIASIFAVAVLASCGGESVEPAVEETVVDTTVVLEDETLESEEVVETEGEDAMAE